MRIRASAVGALLCGLAAGSAHAHGVVGQRSFIEPFIAEDVNPKNEFVIGRPEWDHSRDGRTLGLGFGLEKKLSDRFGITLDPDESAGLVAQMMKVAADDVAAIPLYYAALGVAFRKGVTGPGGAAPSQAANAWNIHTWDVE